MFFKKNSFGGSSRLSWCYEDNLAELQDGKKPVVHWGSAGKTRAPRNVFGRPRQEQRMLLHEDKKKRGESTDGKGRGGGVGEGRTKKKKKNKRRKKRSKEEAGRGRGGCR